MFQYLSFGTEMYRVNFEDEPRYDRVSNKYNTLTTTGCIDNIDIH